MPPRTKAQYDMILRMARSPEWMFKAWLADYLHRKGVKKAYQAANKIIKKRRSFYEET